MNFLKSFFDDDSHIIGLCGFDLPKTKHVSKPFEADLFSNSYQNTKKIFSTNYSKNTFLSM